MKAKSRSLKSGIIGYWAGDIAYKFSGEDNGFKGAAIPTPSGGSPTFAVKPAMAKPQAYFVIVHENSDCEILNLSNTSIGRRMEIESGDILFLYMRRTAAACIMYDSPPEGSARIFTFRQHN